MADTNAPTYNPAPINRLPLKPITMEDIAVNTVAITEAITFIPHSKVISPSVLLSFTELHRSHSNNGWKLKSHKKTCRQYKRKSQRNSLAVAELYLYI